MAGERFHGKAADKRRGGNLPARLRFTARRGVTLIELMIAMLILALVCVSWLEIIGIQSAKKEARRREAVERLAGMMDAFMYAKRSGSVAAGVYYMATNASHVVTFKKLTTDAQPVFDSNVSPIGYQLRVVASGDLPDGDRYAGKWVNKKWLIGALYNSSGTLTEREKNNPFFTLSVCLGL